MSCWLPQLVVCSFSNCNKTVCWKTQAYHPFTKQPITSYLYSIFRSFLESVLRSSPRAFWRSLAHCLDSGCLSSLPCSSLSTQNKTLSNIEIQFNEFKYINFIASLHRQQHITRKYLSQYKYPRITDDLIVIILLTQQSQSKFTKYKHHLVGI